MTSSAWTRERRVGMSTCTPRRASLYARSPPIFTADAAGIGSSTSPRRRASRRSSSAGDGGSFSATTAPSGSPVAVRAVRSTSVTYRLSSPTKHEASLVALPDNKSNNPVAKGSRVPAWPVRATVRARRRATIANGEGPAGLSTRTIPVGSSARGGKKLAAHEVCDLLDRRLTREAGRLAVPSPAGLPRDRRDVELVDACPQAHAASWTVLPRRLPNQHGHVRALDGAQVVDDAFRVRLRRADLGEVRADEVRDHDAAALVDLRPLERTREQLQLRELHRLVDALEDPVHVGTRL